MRAVTGLAGLWSGSWPEVSRDGGRARVTRAGAGFKRD
jgi:hypothetical protein